MGTWELRKTSGAMNPAVSEYPAGNGHILTFTDNDYGIYVNGQLTKSGTYTIVNDSTVSETVYLQFPAGRFPNRIVYDNDYGAGKVFMEISNNRLVFISGNYAVDGGHSEEYERVADTVAK